AARSGRRPSGVRSSHVQVSGSGRSETRVTPSRRFRASWTPAHQAVSPNGQAVSIPSLSERTSARAPGSGSPAIRRAAQARERYVMEASGGHAGGGTLKGDGSRGGKSRRKR